MAEKDGFQRWLPVLVAVVAWLLAMPASILAVLQLQQRDATLVGAMLTLYQLAAPAVGLAVLIGIYWSVRPKRPTYWRLRHGLSLCRDHEALILQQLLKDGRGEFRWDLEGLQLLLDFGIVREQSRIPFRTGWAFYDLNPKARRMAQRLLKNRETASASAPAVDA